MTAPEQSAGYRAAAEDHRRLMEGWINGERSHVNQRLDLSENRAVALAMIDVADAARAVAHAAAFVAYTLAAQSDSNAGAS